MATAWAFRQTGEIQLGILLFTVLSGLCLQMAVNFFNDALDFKKGIDLSSREGPPRLTATGKVSFSTVRLWGILSCAMAWIFALPLILKGGWPILILGVVSCLLTYFYTAGPFSLLKTGLSEIFCFLFFGPVVVFGAYYLQSLNWNIHLIYIGIPCGLWSLSLLLINFLRDEEEDRKGGRKHFVTTYGRTNALFFLTVIQAFIYLLCFYWLGMGLKAGAFSFFVLPLSVGLLYQLYKSPSGKQYNRCLAFCSLNYILFGAAWILGLL